MVRDSSFLHSFSYLAAQVPSQEPTLLTEPYPQQALPIPRPFIVPRHRGLPFCKFPPLRPPHQIAMHWRAQIIPHLHPLLAWVPPRTVQIESIHVHEPVRLVARFAVVCGFDKGFDAKTVGFVAAPADKEFGGTTATVFWMDKENGED